MAATMKDRVKAGRKISARYSKTLTLKNPKIVQPEWTIRPKGNPLKGRYGFKIKAKF